MNSKGLDTIYELYLVDYLLGKDGNIKKEKLGEFASLNEVYEYIVQNQQKERFKIDFPFIRVNQLESTTSGSYFVVDVGSYNIFYEILEK